ncbi:hypothetical protein PLICRDRAFT_41768 [Plicaturopsis crispa FD-325 SS-3]|nr:hypothetical protein PLICRDRAFT_41768 [Plicaturopsis crispa FD-325 SS-3]
MEGPLKELAKLDKLTSKSPAKGKLPSIDILDSLLQSLRDAKASVEDGTASEDTLVQLAHTVKLRKEEIDKKQKEVYNSLTRYGKLLDKTFSASLPSYSPLFASPESAEALERTIALHFLRTGQFATAETFLEETGTNIPPDIRAHFFDLHSILTALRNQDIGPALEWSRKNKRFLQDRSSPLEFYLHRSQYMRLLLSNPGNHLPALSYARTALRPFYSAHTAEFQRLTACITYLPLSRLRNSPYADLASPSLHLDLEPLFAKEYCASLGMSRQVPLRVVGDIGGGGALAKIEKGRKVMRERKSEWSQTSELPIEIPLSAENRYHSIFACPVSKEQATEQNPPMMMTCGHVITRDSLQKLSKVSGRAKCPYCPSESQTSTALRVYF